MKLDSVLVSLAAASFLMLSPSARADAAADAARLAPKGMQVEQALEGDLNGDGRKDLVATLSPAAASSRPAAEGESSGAAELRIWFRGADGALAPALLAPRAVCMDCGGMGNPGLNGTLSLSPKGVLSVSFEGGSGAHHWSVETKWRWSAAGKLALIGWTTTSEGHDEGDETQVDINVLTRKGLRERIGPKGKKLVKPCQLPKNVAEVDLASFSFEDEAERIPAACK